MHDKEFILKLIMDTVYPVELVPIMVKIQHYMYTKICIYCRLVALSRTPCEYLCRLCMCGYKE